MQNYLWENKTRSRVCLNTVSILKLVFLRVGIDITSITFVLIASIYFLSAEHWFVGQELIIVLNFPLKKKMIEIARLQNKRECN